MLELLACSKVRRAAISALLTGPKNISELATLSSRANTIHLIEPLLDSGMVIRKDNTYELSIIGRANAIVLQDTLDAIEVLQADFWKTHDLSSIPDRLMRRIGDLKGGAVVQPNGDLLKAQHNFVDLITHAKEIYGVSSVFFQEWPDMILEALRNGAKVHLVLSPEIKPKLPENFLIAAQFDDNFDLKFQPCRAALSVADNILSIGLFAIGGGYDPLQDFICESGRAAAWGRAFYNYFS